MYEHSLQLISSIPPGRPKAKLHIVDAKWEEFFHVLSAFMAAGSDVRVIVAVQCSRMQTKWNRWLFDFLCFFSVFFRLREFERKLIEMARMQRMFWPSLIIWRFVNFDAGSFFYKFQTTAADIFDFRLVKQSVLNFFRVSQPQRNEYRMQSSTFASPKAA